MDYELLRIILSFCFLIPLIIFDIKQRSAPFVYFIGFTILVAILYFLDLTPLYALILSPLYFVIWRAGIFGGGDMFTLSILSMLLGGQLSIGLGIFLNALLLSTSIIGVNFIRNMIYYRQNKMLFSDLSSITMKDKLIACCLGYRAKNPKNTFLMQVDGALAFKMKHAEQEQFTDKKDVWVFSTIPFMVFIFVGFLAELFYGNILFLFVNLKLSL